MDNRELRANGNSKRHGGLDALRALAALFVIVNHATYLPAGSGEDAKWCAAVIYTIALSAVPLFVMMSGAFILNRDKNSNARAFYWHSFKKLFPLSALMFLVYFCLYTDYPLQFVQGTESLGSMVKHFLVWYGNGAAAPLWYICMLPGLYLLAPLFVIIRRNTSLRVQMLLCGMFMALYFCQYGLHLWNLVHPLSAVSWIGYFLLGMILMNLAGAGRLPSVRSMLWCSPIILAVLVFMAYGYIAGHDDIYPQFEGIMTPSSLLVACGLFIIFAQLKDISCGWLGSKFAEVSFLVYLTHVLVQRLLRCALFHLDLISNLHHDYVISFSFTVLSVILTFLMSWGMHIAYKKLCVAIGACLAKCKRQDA